MKKGIILLNGEPYSGTMETRDSYIICCDGAYNWAIARGIRIDLCVGDFDSLGFIPDGAEVSPVEKDKTDGEIALDIAHEKGCDYVEIYGGSGRREDHFLGNIGLLSIAKELGIKALFISDYTEFKIAEKEERMNLPVGTTISVVPISSYVHINKTEGLKYDASGLTIRRGESRGLSNKITQSHALIEFGEGEALIFTVRQL